MQQSYADNRVRFVDAAIGGDARVELRQSRPVAERSAAVIAGAGVNPIEFHGGCPVRASWTARSRTATLPKRRPRFKDQPTTGPVAPLTEPENPVSRRIADRTVVRATWADR